MAIEVQLKRGHPTGTYHRGGFTFEANTVYEFTKKQFTDEIRNDPYLVATVDGEAVEKDYQIEERVAAIDAEKTVANQPKVVDVVTPIDESLTPVKAEPDNAKATENVLPDEVKAPESEAQK